MPMNMEGKNSFILQRIGKEIENLIRQEFEVNYIDDSLMYKGFNPNKYFDVNHRHSTLDTLTIKTSRKIVDILHRYQGIGQFNYLLKRGDTVHFKIIGRVEGEINSALSFI